MARDGRSGMPGLGIARKKIVLPPDLPMKLAECPRKMRNLTGYVFDCLTVYGFIGRHKHEKAEWLCLCDCGTYKILTTFMLLIGKQRSCSITCPAYKAKYPGEPPVQGKIQPGFVYDRVTIVDFYENNHQGNAIYKCKCLCGNDCIKQEHVLYHKTVRCSKSCNLKMTDPACQKYVQGKILKRIKQNRAKCWLWQGRFADGQPVIHYLLYFQNNARYISFMAFKHDLPYGSLLSQECGNTLCVNPAHMKIPPPPPFKVKW